jgi:diaminohydroxyphosphoribosylaminopyrimidine deaminase/5-amino-6-(5-phosphoribosylamino)uracil reductase
MSTKKDKFTLKDKFYMEIALDLARSRHGLTGLNPSVGCVVVKNDKIISIGQTSFNGRPHAEFNAINNSYENLEGSKMYVTLEPCCHHGLTQPCTDIIIKSKISEVIYAVTDIDKRVRNKSFKILNSKRIIVKKGLLKNRIENFYAPYFFNRSKNLPYVTGKMAISKNNIIYSKLQKKITNIYSDHFTHLLRYQNDSLMITYKTLNKDNPRLNCRLKGLENFSPKRIILDSELNSNINSYIIKTSKNKNTLIFYNKANKSKISKFKKKGIVLIKSKIDRNKNINIKEVLKKLFNYGCRNLLVEGGNNLTNTLIKNKIFNKFYLFKSPKYISKTSEYLKFEGLSILNQKYKKKINLNLNLRKDKITLYR